MGATLTSAGRCTAVHELSWPVLDCDAYGYLPTQSSAWMRARATLIRGGEELRWFAEEDANGNPLALLPLVKVEGWWRELPLMFEPSDLVWQNELALGRLV